MPEQIDILKLKVGDKVHYQPEHYKDGEFENGLIKEIPEFAFDKDHMYFNNIRVVYNCNGEWHRYKDYTSALTNIRDLKLGWME